MKCVASAEPFAATCDAAMKPVPVRVMLAPVFNGPELGEIAASVGATLCGGPPPPSLGAPPPPPHPAVIATTIRVNADTARRNILFWRTTRIFFTYNGG